MSAKPPPYEITPPTEASVGRVFMAEPGEPGAQEEFKILVQGTGSRTHSIRVKPGTTALQLRQRIYEVDGTPVAAQRILYRGKEIKRDDDGTAISNLGIRSDSKLQMSWRFDGGSQPQPQPLPQPQQRPQGQAEQQHLQVQQVQQFQFFMRAFAGSSPPFGGGGGKRGEVTFTTKPDHKDYLTLENDEGTPRVVLPCGRDYLTPESMAQWAKQSILEGVSSSLTLNPVDLECPNPECKRVFDYDWYVKACGKFLSASDESEISERLSRNAMRRLNVRHCVHCKSDVEARASDVRVACPRCHKPFCNKCNSAWTNTDKATSAAYCGNENCLTKPGAKLPSEYFLEADEKENLTKVIAGVTVPESRICPVCKSCIAHVRACKHMKCQNAGCQAQFCFICLAVMSNGMWPKECGAHNFACKVAPRQNITRPSQSGSVQT